jgi:hypothetical protein
MHEVPGQLGPIAASPALPALIAAAGRRARSRFFEYFGARVRNPIRRRSYGRAVADFPALCAPPPRGADLLWWGLMRHPEGRRTANPGHPTRTFRPVTVLRRCDQADPDSRPRGSRRGGGKRALRPPQRDHRSYRSPSPRTGGAHPRRRRGDCKRRRSFWSTIAPKPCRPADAALTLVWGVSRQALPVTGAIYYGMKVRLPSSAPALCACT